MEQKILNQFIELATFDHKCHLIEQKIAALTQEYQKMTIEIQKLENNISVLLSHKNNIEQQLQNQEATVIALQAEEKKLNDLAQSIKTAQEYESSLKELEHVRLNRNKQEQLMMQLTNKLNHAAKEAHLLVKQHDVDMIAQRETMQKKLLDIEIMQKELQEIIKHRSGKETNLPTDILSVYQRMRGKVIDPFVPVNNDSCSACFYFMSACDVQLLKYKGLLQCKDCFRFLYIPNNSESQHE